MDETTRKEIRKIAAETLRDAGLTEPPLSEPFGQFSDSRRGFPQAMVIPSEGVWNYDKPMPLRWKIVGITRCKFQLMTFGYRGLQRVRHLPAILPPQRCCEVCHGAVNDQDGEAIE